MGSPAIRRCIAADLQEDIPIKKGGGFNMSGGVETVGLSVGGSAALGHTLTAEAESQRDAISDDPLTLPQKTVYALLATALERYRSGPIEMAVGWLLVPIVLFAAAAVPKFAVLGRVGAGLDFAQQPHVQQAVALAGHPTRISREGNGAEPAERRH